MIFVYRFMGILALFFCFFNGANAKQDLIYRNFWHPLYHHERLNYCALDNKSCGLQVATEYCKSLGYKQATQAIKAHNVGLTRFFTSSARCKGWKCDGFMTIGCSIPVLHSPPKPYHYRKKRFVVPRFNHYRVDYCYEKNHGCGRRAANAFCERLGYSKAIRYSRETNIHATKNLGQEALCFGGCQAFKEIVCFR